jgi:hypothetical protein
MGIRQTLGEKKALGIAAAALALILGAVAVAYQVSEMGPAKPAAPQTFYTDDDGKTFFTDSTALMPPFDHKGKTAVRAYVYECNGHRFVAYLERYTDQAKRMVKELEDDVKNAKPGDKPPANLAELMNARRFGREVKRPGDATWVSIGSKEGGKVQAVHPPPGLSGEPQLVTP